VTKPRAVLLAGYGINCEEETAFAFRYAGADADIIHINDIIAEKGLLSRYQILVFPGGFSYGDDTGSGLAMANRIKNNLVDELASFIERDTLILGICNGFQVMVNTGIVPGFRTGENRRGEFSPKVEVALEHNNTFRYQCRWVDLKVEKESPSVFTRGIDFLHIPVAHGEGNFTSPSGILERIENENCVTMRYVKPDGAPAGGEFPSNPNGSLNDIASICDTTGRIMGMMPHPERGMFFTQRDDWPLKMEQAKRNGEVLPEEADGIRIFRNAVEYYQ
jgi:phosphoribosylformylglycinamidine synthase